MNLSAFTAWLPQSPKQQGILCIVLAMFLLSLMAALGKHLSETYPVCEVVFFRCLFALLPLLPLIIKQGGMAVVSTKNLKGHLGRCFFGIISMICYFYALHMLPLANAIVVFFTSPLFITIFSIFLLKEQVGIYRWGAVIVGFIGVVIAAWPQDMVFNIGILIALLSAMTSGLAVINLRQLGKTETALTTTVWFTLFSIVFSAPLAALDWKPPGFGALLLFMLCGVLAGISQLCLSKAYQLADPTVISPFNYTSILWAALIGFLFWGHFPEGHEWVGSILIFASGLYILHREHVKKIQPLAMTEAPD
jgi:drug/metabolite transporter (DMT)-like permease